jgi:phage terminase large subunit-like protein
MPHDVDIHARTLAREPRRVHQQCLVDPGTGKPFVLLDAERWFLKFAFTLDEDGRLLFPELIYGAIKKSGKTTFAAVIVIALLLLFGGRYAEAYIVANDLEQAQSRVFEMCRRIVEASPMLRSEARVTANRITFTATGATITALASDYASAAGGHPTISVFDELWGYTSERSRRLWDEMIPVPTRKISCRLTVSYAGFEGESELLHELYKRGSAQPLVGKDLHAGDGMLMFWSHTPVAPWQTQNWLTEMRRSLRANQYLRMIENRFVTTESTFIDMDWWDACTDHALTPVITDRSLPIWVGVDASVKRDSTAIVAVTWDEVNQKVRVVAHKVFQPSADQPLDFEMAIEHTLIALQSRFDLRVVWFDPYQMHASAQRLQREGIEIEEFPQTVANLTEASQNLYELIKGKNLVVYHDDAMRLAISRAVAIETSRGWRIAKEKQAHKIDVVVALGMAALAAVKAQADDIYDHTGRWISEGPPPPEPADVVAARRQKLYELLRSGQPVPF